MNKELIRWTLFFGIGIPIVILGNLVSINILDAAFGMTLVISISYFLDGAKS